MKKIIVWAGIVFLIAGCNGETGAGGEPFSKKWNFMWEITQSPDDLMNGSVGLLDIKIDCDDANMTVDPSYGRKCSIDYTDAVLWPPIGSWKMPDDSYRTFDLLQIWEKKMVFHDIEIEMNGTVAMPLFASISATDLPTGQCKFPWDDRYIDNLRKGKKFFIESIGGDVECKITFHPNKK